MVRRSMVLTVLLILWCVQAAYAQTPTATENVGTKPKPGEPSMMAPSAFNPWLGSQVGYKVGGGTHDIADNLLVSVRFFYDVDLGLDRFRLPVLSNVSDLTIDASAKATPEEQITQKIQELANSANGAVFGAYPYFKWKDGEHFYCVLHSEFSFKINGVKDTADVIQYLQQFRIAGGVEVGLGKLKRLTVSLTENWSTFMSDPQLNQVLAGAPNSITTTNITAVFPLRPNLGVLADYIDGKKVPISGKEVGNTEASYSPRSFRFGVIVAVGELGKRK